MEKLAQVDDVAGKEFDFVIIGGGTAGCVLASRLSEDPRVSVAVLEAALSHLDDKLIPDQMSWMKQILNPEYDWMYWSTEQPLVREKDPFLFPRGRSLGGTSAINFLIWNLPQREEIDALETLGNTGWNWRKFHHYAKKVEKFCPTKSNYTPDFRDLYKSESVGHDGPIPISFSRTGCGLEFPWQKALEKNGVATATDCLSGRITGTWKSICTVDPETGTRVNAAKGYLVPALDRPNLKVLTEAFVHRIVTSDRPECVRGEAVVFEHSGKIYNLSAKKEIVVCAGTVKSPQILELSGIGDATILGPLGIPVQVNLPGVGTNVQEHVTVGAGLYKLKEVKDRLIITSDMLQDPAFQSTLLEAHSGLDTPWKLQMNGLSFVPIQVASERASAFVHKQTVKFEKNGDKYPPGLREQYEVQLKLLEERDTPEIELLLFPFAFPKTFPEPEKPYCYLIPTLVHPFSRGTIHAGSADPKASPVIDPRYLEEEIDLDILVEAFKFIRRVAQTEPFKDLVFEEVSPGSAVNSDSDEEVAACVKKHLWSSWHTCGSNSMLPRDKNGVVDPKLKVYGTKNIRVVDLSIMPLMPAVHPQGSVYTIAEIAADIIKAEYA